MTNTSTLPTAPPEAEEPDTPETAESAEIVEERDGGFTLIELLVVVLILGVLATVAVVATTGAQSQAEAQACVSTKRTIETAFTLWELDGGTGFTTPQASLVPNYIEPGSAALVSEFGLNTTTGQFEAVPNGECDGLV